MIEFKINDVVYKLKQNLKEVTVKDYFDIIKIQSERCQKPVTEDDKYVDGTYDIKYYDKDDEPEEFRLKKNARIMNILSGIPAEYFEEYEELYVELSQYVLSLNDESNPWKSTSHYDTVTQKIEVGVDLKGKKKYKNVDVTLKSDEHIWTLSKPNTWCFQQWVDAENASKQEMYLPFIIAVTKKNTSLKTQRNKKYNRSHPDLDDKLDYWLNQPAEGNVNTIMQVLNEMASVRAMFYWIYEFESAYPEKQKKTEKIYSTFAGWNDVVVSLSKTNAFNSPTGTLNAVRTANCIDVLEYLNWERGKSAAEYEDYKEEEQKKKLGNLIG